MFAAVDAKTEVELLTSLTNSEWSRLAVTTLVPAVSPATRHKCKHLQAVTYTEVEGGVRTGSGSRVRMSSDGRNVGGRSRDRSIRCRTGSSSHDELDRSSTDHGCCKSLRSNNRLKTTTKYVTSG